MNVCLGLRGNHHSVIKLALDIKIFESDVISFHASIYRAIRPALNELTCCLKNSTRRGTNMYLLTCIEGNCVITVFISSIEGPVVSSLGEMGAFGCHSFCKSSFDCTAEALALKNGSLHET